MPYLRKVIRHGIIIEDNKYTNGRYGRAKKNNPAQGETPPEQKKWQTKEAIRKVWRMIDDNFQPGDLWVMFSLPRNARPNSEQVREIMETFLKKIRKLYRKAGQELKYIFSAGRGKQGAIHFHMVMSKFDMEEIKTVWEDIVNNGEWVKTDFQPLSRHRDYYKLASYVIKNGEETFLSDDPIYKKRYCTSRNVKQKKTRATVVKAKEWKKEPVERPGYYIDKERSYSGFNAYGYPVQYTVYVKLEGGRKDGPNKKEASG